MNFIEAVQALADGRCEGIARKKWQHHLLWNDSCIGMKLYHKDYLATDWELVGEKPEVEEVEVKVWGVFGNNGKQYGPFQYNSIQNADNYIATTKIDEEVQVVEFTGTYTRPKPKKVKRREEILLHVNGGWFFKDRHSKSDAGREPRFYAEWEEEQ